MRSLVVTHTFPWPPRGGGAIRASQTIDALAGLGSVDVACILQPSGVAAHQDEIGAAPVDRVLLLARPAPRIVGWRRLPWLVAGRLPSTRTADYGDLRARFRAWAGDYDLVWLGCGTEGFVALGDLLAGQPLVANLDDLEDRKLASRWSAGPLPDGPRPPGERRSELAGHILRRTEIARWQALHRTMARRVARLVVCSEVDRRALTSLGISNVDVVPNVYPDPRPPAGRLDVLDPPTLTMVGTLHYPPNLDAARFMVRSILPEVRRRVPGVELRLVGRLVGDTEDLTSAPGVVATGEVEDLEDELRRAAVAVVPVRWGSGTRIKILEAFAHRIPVVSTTAGAEGLDVEDGRELVLADDPANFAAACADLLTDRSLRRRLADAGHRRWSADHRLDVVGRRVATVAKDVIRTDGAPAKELAGSARPECPIDGSHRHRVCALKYTWYLSDPRVRREAEALAADGHDVTVLALAEPGRPPVEEVAGVRVVRVPVVRYRGGSTARYLASYARFFLRAALHLGRQPRRYDLVHVHTLPEAMVFAAVVPKIAGRPVLLDVGDLSTEVFVSRRGRAPLPIRAAERLALGFADRIVTVHDEYRDRIARRGIPRARIAVVLNSPDGRLFPLRSPTVPRCPPRLLYHGLFAERYGLATALQGLAMARSAVPGVRLDLVGDGDFRPTMAALIDRLDLGREVTMSPGPVPIDDIPRYIAAADVGLVPLAADEFTQAILPTKLLEFVRMGKPVIVVRNPVIEHYFADDDVYFVDPGRPEDIAHAVARIAARPDEAAERASKAQQFFDREDWTVNRDRFLTLVAEVAERR